MSGQLHRRLAALEAARAHHRPYLAARAAAEQATPAVTVLESPDPAPGAELALPVVGQRWTMRPERGTRTRTVTITRVWDTDTGPAVAYKWRDGQPRTCRTACPVGVFLRAYVPAGDEPTAAAVPPVLSDGERSYLLFALELAEDEMRARGTEFGDDDRATLTSLRKLVEAEQQAPEGVTDPWAVVARLTAWLDDHNGSSTPETALRLLKVAEEAGEVAAAWIGVTGQNPRKGVTHDVADVVGELCDVIVAAMVAMTTLTRDPAARFAAKLQEIAALRLDTAGGES